MKIPFSTLRQTIEQALLRAGVPAPDAQTLARIHTESTLDGFASHGLNRIPRFVEYIGKGWINLHAAPERVKQLGPIEIYEGHRAPGVLNALHCTDRAMAVAAEQGIALIAVRSTNHWMRGGTYGWRAANRGFLLIAWTNTESCMPAWGARDPRLGNNPLILAAPRPNGPVVLDMAMSQYSYGKLQTTRLKGERLPTPGGFDSEGLLTCDPGPIEQSQRLLPTGLWKGSGLAILLDLLAAVLSEGRPTSAIDALHLGSCVGCSQIFLAIDPRHLGGQAAAADIANSIVESIHQSAPADPAHPPTYPGEQTLLRREQQRRDGIEVDETIWLQVQALAR